MISKIGVKTNSRIITKNDAADPEIGFLTKSISKPNGRATAMPTAWELRVQQMNEVAGSYLTNSTTGCKYYIK